jgi:hypothetical protein
MQKETDKAHDALVGHVEAFWGMELRADVNLRRRVYERGNGECAAG